MNTKSVGVLEENNFLNKLLIEFEKLNISDIHLKSGCKIYYRLLGDIKIFEEGPILSNGHILEFLKNIINSKIEKDFKENKQADFAFSNSKGTRYRANLYRTNTGYSLALRKINNKVATFEGLGAPDIFKKIVELQKGLVIISGPTGSGKSTTLNAMINYINETQKKHIITIEDPIEFIHINKKCLIDQREVGIDAKSFSLAIKSALREDPDIILLGEIRDSETIKECLMAAETGHLVFTTMHTQTAAKSIDRIIDIFEAGEKDMIRSMLSTSLQAVILQKILKKSNHTDMIAAFEVLIATNAIRNLIKENKIPQIDSMLQTGKRFGMIDMGSYIEDLYNKGLITKEEMESNINKLGKEKND